MSRKSVLVKVLVGLVVVAVLAGVSILVFWPDDPELNSSEPEPTQETPESGEDTPEILRSLIILVQPGRRNALVNLPGVDMEVGALMSDADSALREDGKRLKSSYNDFLSTSSANWLTTSDSWVYASSEELLAGMELNLTVPIMFPAVFEDGVETLYVRMIPLLEGLRDQLPKCLIDLAETEVDGAPEDVVTFWAYLMGEGVDNLNASMLLSMNLTFGEGCLSRGQPVISNDMFLNVTRASTDLLAPMLSNIMMEVLSLGNSEETSGGNIRSVSVYGGSEWHLQLMLMCLQQNTWTGKRRQHIVVELYDSKVNVIYGKRSKSMSTLDFVRYIALCRITNL